MHKLCKTSNRAGNVIKTRMFYRKKNEEKKKKESETESKSLTETKLKEAIEGQEAEDAADQAETDDEDDAAITGDGESSAEQRLETSDKCNQHHILDQNDNLTVAALMQLVMK